MRPALVLWLAACTTRVAQPTDVEWQTQTVTDEGLVCLEAEADGTALVAAWFDGCLSSSCDANPTASCSATLDGATITVHSTFTWDEAQPTEGLFCTDDCQSFPVATCPVGPLAEGTYTLIHGARTETVTVPNPEGCGF